MAIHRGLKGTPGHMDGSATPARVKRGRIGAYRFNKLFRSVVPMIENGEAGIWLLVQSAKDHSKLMAYANVGAMI
jgi:hypothetical protein